MFTLPRRHGGGRPAHPLFWLETLPRPWYQHHVSEVLSLLRSSVLPRTVSPIERALLRLGARFDDFMLRRWMRGDAMAPGVDPALCAHLERAHAFYRNPAFLSDPERFYATPPTPRA